MGNLQITEESLVLSENNQDKLPFKEKLSAH